MRLVFCLVLLVLAALASACGDGEGGPLGTTDAKTEIERDVRAFAEALSQNEIAKAYTFLSEGCREETSLEDFMGSMLFARAFIGEDWEIEITGVDVLEYEGDRAVVTLRSVLMVDGEEVEAAEGEEEPETLVREDGKWRITDCEGFAPSEDSGGFFEEDQETVEISELTTITVGESFEVEAEDLPKLYGEDSLSGTISFQVTDVETRSTIDSEFEGTQRARGKFIVVYYEVASDLNRRMQPSTQINDELVLTDERERQWEVADYEGDYFGISGDAADTVGCDAPEGWVGAGFTGCTAAVFDVPTDAEGLALAWKAAGVSVDLEPLER